MIRFCVLEWLFFSFAPCWLLSGCFYVLMCDVGSPVAGVVGQGVALILRGRLIESAFVQAVKIESSC